MVVVRPTSTVTLVALNAPNPLAVISTEYTPGAKWLIRKRPPSSLLPLALAPVPKFFALTPALGTTAPDGSVTVPPMAPSVVDCANAPQANNMMAIRARQHCTTDFSILFVLMEVSLFLLSTTLRAVPRGPKASGVKRSAPHSLGRDRSGCKPRLSTATHQHPNIWPIFYHKKQVH